MAGAQSELAAVKTFADFTAADATARAYAALCRGTIPSSLLYIETDLLHSPGAAHQIDAFLPAALAAFVVDHLRKLHRSAPPAVMTQTHGFELWSTRPQRSTTGQIYLHVDCDEQLRKQSGAVRAPMLGSILYVGPGTGLIGGETAFVEDARLLARYAPFGFHDWRTLAAERGVKSVIPAPGKLVVFDGAQAHGQAPVVDHPGGHPRVALLANFWDRRIGPVPAGLCAITADEFRSRSGLSFNL